MTPLTTDHMSLSNTRPVAPPNYKGAGKRTLWYVQAETENRKLLSTNTVCHTNLEDSNPSLLQGSLYRTAEMIIFHVSDHGTLLLQITE